MGGIDPRALVSPTAELAADVTVGAYSVIGDGVKIGPGTWVGPHAVVTGNTTLGAGGAKIRAITTNGGVTIRRR